MRASIASTLILAAGLAAPTVAAAGSSAWFDTDGARIRLLTAEAADAGGTLRGALEIVLEPGWKTYWRDPGDAGIPPQIDISASTNVSGAVFDFPAPVRFHEGWAGYAQSVSLPVRFAIPDPAHFSAVEADIFLGICKEVCVPVQARLSAAQQSAASDAESGAAVEAAFAALPGPASEGFGIAGLRDEGSRLVATATLAGDADAELFVVTPTGWVLRPPEAARADGAVSFSIPVAERPTGAAAGPVAFDYTLVSGGKSVSGTARLD
ncbi:MAG: protein-disulfide reductase DsbD family protein [Mesorhizobium sp.]|nr:protein-disulfide reductase DsbD family protein [Mesorhizobium sp.]